ncbi:Hypothetical predicted protein [Octopus vulgaris]|uniref:PiggyBac transposable element-derived protein domain-containing protein n=1 Tax=Octopus vulgaris TaxID=6645 RepID=A0AA36AZS5_OCTVU|nr:Hypothetical predicted protein [Octopus vulgaris]
MPFDLRKPKLEKGEFAYRSTDSGLLALAWRDRKYVTMLSTMYSAAMSETGKRNRAGDSHHKTRCCTGLQQSNVWGG